MFGNPQKPGRRPEDALLDGLLGGPSGRRPRRDGRTADPLSEALDRWLDWLEPPRPPKPWCGSTPSGR
jgi:hypothetical protein